MSFWKQKKIYLLVLLLVFVVPNFSLAAGLVPCGGTGENPCTVIDFFILVARATNWLLRMAGIFAVYKIANTGWGMIIAQGEEEALAGHKKTLTSVVLGFCLTMIAYMVVNTAVNVILVQNRPNCQVDLTHAWDYVINIKESKCQGGK